MTSLWTPSFPIWHFLLRGAVVYLATLALIRFGGKREIGQMGTGQFVAILLISNAVQNSMNGGDNSITGGVILAAVIVALSVTLSYVMFKSKAVENLIQGRPTILIRDGAILHAHLKHELLSVEDLMILLRKQGIHHVRDISMAILESDGSLTLVHPPDDVRPQR